ARNKRTHRAAAMQPLQRFSLEKHTGPYEKWPMPGEIELARQFGASRVTMRRVFDYLVKEGLVRRHRGMGTFVVKPDDPLVMGGGQTLLQNIIDVGERTSAVVVEFE